MTNDNNSELPPAIDVPPKGEESRSISRRVNPSLSSSLDELGKQFAILKSSTPIEQTPSSLPTTHGK